MTGPLPIAKAIEKLEGLRAALVDDLGFAQARLDQVDEILGMLRGKAPQYDLVSPSDVAAEPHVEDKPLAMPPPAAETRATMRRPAPAFTPRAVGGAPATKGTTLTDKIIAHVSANPGATAREITAAINHPLASVRASISPLVPGRLTRHGGSDGTESRYTLQGIDMPGTPAPAPIPAISRVAPHKDAAPAKPTELTGALQMIASDVLKLLQTGPKTQAELFRRTAWPGASIRRVVAILVEQRQVKRQGHDTYSLAGGDG